MTKLSEDTGQYVMLGPPSKRYMAMRATAESRWRVSKVQANPDLSIMLTLAVMCEHMWQVEEYVKEQTS